MRDWEDVRLEQLKEPLEHLSAKNAAMDHHCEVTTVYAARILAKYVKDDISYNFIKAANQVCDYLTLPNAVRWMRNEANYTQRFALVAFIFKLAEEGIISTTGLDIYQEMDLEKHDYDFFQQKHTEFKILSKQEQQRQAMLVKQCDVAMARLVGEMLRLNSSNYQQRAYKAVKVLHKLDVRKHGYLFYQKILQNDSLTIDEAIESVCLGLIPKNAKKFVKLMFEIAVEEDGIKNDEWRLLMRLLAHMKFEKQIQANFVDYYQSLRTEFDTEDLLKKEDEAKILAEYREALGVTEESTIKDIQNAFHKLAMKHHPDLPKNAGRKEECEQFMAKINNAYTHLVLRKQDS